MSRPFSQRPDPSVPCTRCGKCCEMFASMCSLHERDERGQCRHFVSATGDQPARCLWFETHPDHRATIVTLGTGCCWPSHP